MRIARQAGKPMGARWRVMPRPRFRESRGFAHGPGLTLVALLALGVALAGFTWGLHWKNVARMAAEQPDDPWLEEQTELLRRQNDRLIEEIWRLQMPDQRQERWERPVEIEEAVAAVWGSPFPQEPIYRLAHPHDIAMIRQRDLNHWLNDQAFEALALFLGMVGLCDPQVNLQQSWARLSEESAPIVYDHESRAILVDPTLDPRRPDARRQIGAALALLRMDEDGRVARALAGGDGTVAAARDFDGGLARRIYVFGLAAYLGDLADHRLADADEDPLPIPDAGSGAAVEEWLEAPDILRHLHAYPDLEGASWWAALDEKSGRAEMMRRWREGAPPPGTHVFLGLDETAVTGRLFGAFAADAGIIHEWSTILGPLVFQFLVFEALGMEAAEQAVAGWREDAFHLGAKADGGLVAEWEVEWRGPEDGINAKDLLERLGDALAQRIKVRLIHWDLETRDGMITIRTRLKLELPGEK